MSKNISIAEGGVARQFTNDKLKINLVGGGTEYYVPESGVQLTTKSVTANGTYKASDVGEYGFSQFSVNVRGGAGSAGSDGKPTTSGGTAPGGAGSAVVGTDPTTGNDVAVGVDEDGNLVQTPVPSAIQIVTPPTKTAYTYQETMDYSGIVVAAKEKDGTTFTDARYTNGHIPMQELIFPVDKAPAGSGGHSATIDDTSGLNPSGVSTMPLPFNTGGMTLRSDRSGGTNWIVSNNEDTVYNFHLIQSGHDVGGAPTFCSKKPFSVTLQQMYYETVAWQNTYDAAPYTYNGETVYVYILSSAWGGSINTYTPAPAVIYYDGGEIQIATAWNLLYCVTNGRILGDVTIPVKWLNPYTGDTHQDTFQITSTPSTGSSSTTTGSTGTEGAGGGGSF